MGIRILTDSAGDLRPQEIEDLQIVELPIVILVDDQEFYENETIQKSQVYDRLKEGKRVTTAQITLHRFLEQFKAFASAGESCIYVSLSSKLSGTYQAACLAKKQIMDRYPDFDLTIFDSRSVSYGQGLMAKRAAELANLGVPKEMILESLNFFRDKMRIYFTVGTLEYLYKGGRLSKTSALLGGLLGIAPILGIENGQVVVIGKQRGVKKAWRKMIDLMDVETQCEPTMLVVGNSGTLDDVDRFLRLMSKRLPGVNPEVILPGAAIGAHTGPGLQAIFYLAEKEPEKSEG
ncbi:DegV family protein [Gottschalkiaceae bacterium SANA]|nr:DegV family protein [Gottschalkiaceae bacterium SANA]